MLKGKELFLLIFTRNKSEKKKERQEKEKVFMVAKLKKKILKREKQSLHFRLGLEIIHKHMQKDFVTMKLSVKERAEC